MKQSTRRVIGWSGLALILLPTALVVAMLVYFQPHEYQSSVFIEVRQPGQPPPTAPLIERDTLYAILFFVGIYVPGVVLLLTAFVSRRRESKLYGTPTI